MNFLNSVNERKILRAGIGLLVGIILLMFGFAYEINASGAEKFENGWGIINGSNEAFSIKEDVIQGSFNEIEINIIQADDIQIVFEDTDKYTVWVEGQLSNYSLRSDRDSIKIDFTKNAFSSIFNFGYGRAKSIIVTVPKSFNGEIEVNGASYNFTLNSSEEINLRELTFNGVDNTISLENVNTSVQLSGANNTLKGKNLSGKVNSSGVSANVNLQDTKHDIDIALSGVSSTVKVYEGHLKANYNLLASGLSSRYSYYSDNNNTVFGESGFNHHVGDDAPNIKVNASGVDANVIIQE